VRVQSKQPNNNWKRAHLSNTHQGSRWPEKVARTIQFAKLPWRALDALALLHTSKQEARWRRRWRRRRRRRTHFEKSILESVCLCAPGEKTVKESEWAIKSCSREREEVKRKWAHKLNAQFFCRDVQRLTQTGFCTEWKGTEILWQIWWYSVLLASGKKSMTNCNNFIRIAFNS